MVRRASSSAASFDREAYLERAKALFGQRRKTPIFDYMSPTPSHLLNTSLASHIPADVHQPARFRDALRDSSSSQRFRAPIVDAPLPLGHHLVYFGPQSLPSELMPDGTVTDHCPGAPFTRRMWAGGTVRFARRQADAGLRLDRQLAVCVEGVVGEPVIKGAEGEEKVFVELSRKYGYRTVEQGDETTTLEGLVDEAEASPDIDERRTLVFMREKRDDGQRVRQGEKEKEAERDMTRLRRLKDKNWVPTYSFSLTPDRKLLFQFSALTFNAHAIHLDPRYAQEVEGHKDCLVHGPLSLSLMLMAVQAQADKVKAEGDGQVALTELKYRNLAPLYVGEEMKVCVKVREAGIPKDSEEHTWDAWVEGPDGGFAVKGIAKMQVVTESQ
jgi:hydroxyacyl-ACP dehydratase HTD2-like protein with hotdog domain